MNGDIVAKCVEVMEREDLDGLIALSPENFAYVVGFVVPSQPVLRWRHAAAVITRDGRTALYAVDMEASTVRDLRPDQPLAVWEEFAEDAMPVLADLLRDLGLDRSRVGLETDYLPARDLEELRGLVPDVAWIPAHPLFNRLRQLKTPREVELLRGLARLTDRSIKEALESVTVGSTEMDLAGAVTANLFRYGADSFKWLILATGERSQYPNVGPTDRALQPGDLVRLEVFGQLDGYHAGICRTAVVGEPSAEIAGIWSMIVECRDLIFGGVRDGASGAEIYGGVTARFRADGYEPMSFVGHGIGQFVHEEPYVGRYGDARLEAGMVLGVEPVLLLPGKYGFQVKDLVAVTQDGCEVLSDVSNTDQLLVISEA